MSDLTAIKVAYEHECSRSELLGIEKPQYDDFVKNYKPTISDNTDEDPKIINDVTNELTENLEKVNLEDEEIKNVSGGLDELSNILKSTQQKIHKFKNSYGTSITNIIKTKIGRRLSMSDSFGSSNDDQQNESLDTNESSTSTNQTNDDLKMMPSSIEKKSYKSDLEKALDNHNDRFDDLIEKADNAQYSMKYQNKQMKDFLK